MIWPWSTFILRRHHGVHAAGAVNTHDEARQAIERAKVADTTADENLAEMRVHVAEIRDQRAHNHFAPLISAAMRRKGM